MHGHLSVRLVVNILFNSKRISENTKLITFYIVALDFDIVHALTVFEICVSQKLFTPATDTNCNTKFRFYFVL